MSVRGHKCVKYFYMLHGSKTQKNSIMTKERNKSKNITIKIQEMSREENKKKISKMDSKKFT